MLRIACWLVRLTLLGLVVWSLTEPDLAQFQGKAMFARQLLFPLALLVIPLLWRWQWREQRYPFGLDALVLTPFVVDLAGNAFSLYVDFTHFDDAVHLANPVLFVVVIAQVAMRFGVQPLPAWLIAVGLGSTGHILFEWIEYLLLMMGERELGLTLEDTLSDLMWGMLGAITGATLGVLFRPRAVE